MVIYKDKRVISNSDFPDSDFIGDADLVIPDDSEFALKIISLAPDFDIVFDDAGNISDVIPTEPAPPPPEPPTRAELAAAIAELAEVMCGG